MTDTAASIGRPTPRRVTPPPSKRRRHPAARARIAAAGLGASTLFGLVATMGIAHVRAESTPSSTGQAVAAVSPPARTAPLTIVPVPTPPPAPPTVPATDTATAPAAPIVLQARPDVRVITPTPAPAATPAPVATTSGSN